MAEVARLAGVSVITVSRVLREPERVADATRTRVLSAVKAVGYVPNLVARSLKSRRSGIVAAVIPSVAHSIVAEVTRGMNAVLKEEGLHLLLGDSGFSPQEEEELVAAFLARRCDAIYLTGTTHTRNTCRMLETARIPVVEAGALAEHPIDMTVGYSNRDAARAITQALIDRGRRRIAYVGQAGRDVVDRVHDRHAGYRDALKANGLAVAVSTQAEVELSFRGGAAGFPPSSTGATLSTRCSAPATSSPWACCSNASGAGSPCRTRWRSRAWTTRRSCRNAYLPSAPCACRASRWAAVPHRCCATDMAGRTVASAAVDLGFSLVLRETT